eukprot:SAG31_NODE_3554_length_4129_cov_2.346402_1_plen_111_part_00
MCGRQDYDIFVVSQNKDEEEATKWNESCGHKSQKLTVLPHIADSDRLLYDQFGFRRSQEGVWGVASLSFYSDKPPDQLHEPMGQDVSQMGGDIIVDCDGVVRRHHTCHCR